MRTSRYIIACMLVVVGCAKGDRTGDIVPTDSADTTQPLAPLKEGYLQGIDTTKSVVVFIHGIFGSPETSWSWNVKEPSFAHLIAVDESLGKPDVFMVKYQTPLIKSALNIEGNTRTILAHLKARIVFQHRAVILIGHSEGGLIARRIIGILNAGNDDDRATLRQVRAVFLFGTPANGSTAANISYWISLNPQAKDMIEISGNSLLQTLNDEWKQIYRDRYRDISEKHLPSRVPNVYCAYETQKLLLKTIVPQLYSESICDDDLSFVEDHSSLVKPKDRSGIYEFTATNIAKSLKYGQTAATDLPIASAPAKVQAAASSTIGGPLRAILRGKNSLLLPAIYLGAAIKYVGDISEHSTAICAAQLAKLKADVSRLETLGRPPEMDTNDLALTVANQRGHSFRNAADSVASAALAYDGCVPKSSNRTTLTVTAHTRWAIGSAEGTTLVAFIPTNSLMPARFESMTWPGSGPPLAISSVTGYEPACTALPNPTKQQQHGVLCAVRFLGNVGVVPDVAFKITFTQPGISSTNLVAVNPHVGVTTAWGTFVK